jgi:multiple sugar transport system substrate-binding protein
MGLRNRSLGVVAILVVSGVGLAGCGQSSGGGGDTIELTIT